MPVSKTVTRLRDPIQRWGHFWVALLLVLFITLAGRLVHIHARERSQLLDYRDRRQQRAVAIPAQRGVIVDRKARLLAGSQKSPSVFADPAIFEVCNDNCLSLSAAIGHHGDPLAPSSPCERILRAAGRNSRFCSLARDISDDQVLALQELDLPGVAVQYEAKRLYPHKELLCQVLGFVDRDSKGCGGIERAYHDTLVGMAGQFAASCDRSRRLLWSIPQSMQEAEDGFHVELTIDLVIQQALEREVSAAMTEFNAESGVGVIMDPQTGEVLAMTTLPGYDLNDRAQLADANRGNFCISSPVEAGSVFKPFVVAAALAEGTVEPQREFDTGEGVHFFGKRRLRDTHANGVLDVEGILIKSSNIGMGMIAADLGNARLHHYVTQFGFGARTGIDLPGESPGIVPPLRKWNSYSTQSVAMGQEIAITPLQLAAGFSALVNGGLLYQPYIVQSVVDPASSARFERQPRPVRQAIPRNISQLVARKMLRSVVEQSHHDIHSKRYSIVGKTGTAQVASRERRGYVEGSYLASFMGAAPADNPQLVALVMIRKPDVNKGYYGGLVAGPAVRNVLDAALAYLGVPADITKSNTD